MPSLFSESHRSPRRHCMAVVACLLVLGATHSPAAYADSEADISPARAALIEKARAKLAAEPVKDITSKSQVDRFINALRLADETHKKDADFLNAVRDYVDGKLRKEIFETYIKKVWPSTSDLRARPMERAIRNGDVWAELYMALVHLDPAHGVSGGESLEALGLPKEAAWAREQASKLAAAARSYGFFRKREVGRALIESAATKLPRAASLLAWYKLSGYQTVPYDPNHALALAQVAAKHGDPLGHYVLSTIYVLGDGVAKDMDKSLAHLKIAGEEKRFALALTELGRRYALGVGVEKDLVKAAQYYKQASETGSAEGLRQFAVFCVLTGKGVEADPAKAFKMLETAARAGNTEAAANVGYYNAAGKYVKKNLTNAIAWYKMAGARGHARSISTLGYYYSQGIGVEKDVEQGYRYYNRAGSLGYVPGILETARCFQHGRGTTKRTATAHNWYVSAATHEARQSGKRVAEFAKSYREARRVTNTEFVNMVKADPGVKLELLTTSTFRQWLDSATVKRHVETLVKRYGFKLNPQSPYTLRCELSVVSHESTVRRESNRVGGSFTTTNYTTPVIYDLTLERELPVWDGKRFLPHELELMKQYGFSVWTGPNHPSKQLRRDHSAIVNGLLKDALVSWTSSDHGKSKLSDEDWRERHVPKLSDFDLFVGYRGAEHLKELYFLDPLRLFDGEACRVSATSDKTAKQCIDPDKQDDRIDKALRSVGRETVSKGARLNVHVNNMMVRSSGGKVFGLENNPTYVFMSVAMANIFDDVLVPVKGKFVRLESATLDSTLDVSIAKPGKACEPASKQSEARVARLIEKIRAAKKR